MPEHREEDYINLKIKPFDAKSIKNFDEFLQALKYCSFQGRNLGIALDILYKMATKEDCLTVLTLSGAMVPAGMGELLCLLIEHKIVDVVVTTGANTIHDLVDAFADVGHFIGSPNVDDDEMFELRINRIYDTFLPERNYKNAEERMLSLIKEMFGATKKISITPSELLKKMGLKIKERCLISVAATHNIPIFVPAFSDSEFALNLLKYTAREGYDFKIDVLKDVMNFAEIIKKSNDYGTLVLGGGVPRNWAQQVFPLLDQIGGLEGKEMGYKYSVRVHTATEYDGGLSGCTLSESKSWGKYALDAKTVSVWCDATIALPILVMGLLQRLKIL